MSNFEPEPRVLKCVIEYQLDKDIWVCHVLYVWRGKEHAITFDMGAAL